MKRIKVIIMSICSFMALGFNSYGLYLKEYDSLLKLGIVGSLLLILMLYYFYTKKESKKHFVISILSGMFSFLMIFGNSYMNLGNALLVFKDLSFFIIAIIMALGYYFVFRYVLSLLFSFFDKDLIHNVGSVKHKFFDKFEKNPFLFSLIFILICWLPYIISFYPIILSPDPSFQIKQFFGIRTKYADYAVLLDENVVMTNHHPVVHTLLLGGCLKFGRFLGSDNLGLFCYSIIQILVLSSVLAFTIKYMKKLKISSKFCLITLLIYSLVPMFPLYAMSGVKDVLFGAFTILYIMMIHSILKSKGLGYKIKDHLFMFVLMALLVLFRNNGYHMILLSFPFVIYVVRKHYKPFLILFLSLICFQTTFSKVILPYFKITPGSVREMLSVPFQQTARYVKYHEDDLTYEDKQIIDKILGYETLASRYNPELADPVKNEFNKYATSDDLKEYFGLWFRGLIKRPVTYIDSTINNIYGFFYPEKLNWYVYYKYDTRITQDGFDYHYNSLSGVRNTLSSFAVGFPYIPILGLISNIGFSVWIIFTLVGYSIYRKSYENIVTLSPALVLILVCVVGPANTYFRYTLPFVFAIPLMIACTFDKLNYRKIGDEVNEER